jgi:hypothetical protein
MLDREASSELTLDSRQFFPTPASPSIRILIVGFLSPLPMVASELEGC